MLSAASLLFANGGWTLHNRCFANGEENRIGLKTDDRKMIILSARRFGVSARTNGGSASARSRRLIGTEIFYKDWGSGQPIVFSHGWPLSADDWDTQMLFFLQHGYRVIAHDRRGHGRSTQTSDGHDMDHYADDLAAVTTHLDLQDAIHVGHSTGGGEVVRYIARHGKAAWPERS